MSEFFFPSPKPIAKPARPRQYGTSLPQSEPKPIGRNKERQAKEFARCYHSEERVEWVKNLPSVVSGRGPCDNAHVRGGGAGRKADYRFIVPLTRREHNELHRIGPADFESNYSINLEAAADAVEAAWQSLHRPAHQ